MGFQEGYVDTRGLCLTFGVCGDVLCKRGLYGKDGYEEMCF